MKKNLKITLIVLGVLVGIIIFDTLQARLFKNSPIISWKEELGGDNYVDKGIIMNTYYCFTSQDLVTVSWHFKTSKFTCPEQIDYDKDKQSHPIESNNNDVHSFFGRIIESSSSYIIVEPNEGEEERKSSDKFHIKLDKHNDALYEIGTNVKITYIGGIKESYPAQIDTKEIEIKSADSFEIIFNQEPGNVKRQIIDKNTNKLYNYNVYIYNGKVDIVIDKRTYSLEDALKENKITMDEIIKKANRDIPNAVSYDDGGSVEYHYNNYTIIKFHTLDGNRDVYIGNKDLKLSNIK